MLCPCIPSILRRHQRGLDDIHQMGMDAFFLECRRTNDITWQNYMVAGVDDVVKDLQWESWQLGWGCDGVDGADLLI